MRENGSVVETVTRIHSGIILPMNTVLRNTYLLLSMTLLFSAGTAWLSMLDGAPRLGFLAFPLYFALLFMTQALRNSGLGILMVFAFTGFLGYTAGPLLTSVIHNFSNGPELIMAAFALTGLIFLGLSAYVLVTQKDFSYLMGFLFVASLVLMLGTLVSLFFPVPLFYVLILSGFVLISSGFILFETSQIIHGGERNYLMATISLYVSLFNLFTSLLQLLSILGGRQRD